jgi:hypothetical protein
MLSRIFLWVQAHKTIKRFFENSLALSLKYFYYRRIGINASLQVVCLNGDRGSISVDELNKLIVASRERVVKSYSCKDREFVTIFEDVVPVNELMKTNYMAIKLGWRYNRQGGYWVFNNVKLKHVSVTAIEVFNMDQYERLKHVTYRDVVDIGAANGDSAIYFALRGARRVVAIEYDHELFMEMLENIRLNNLEERIIPINHYATSGTLKIILNKYNINDGILKMDCEGCEYEVLLKEETEVLRKFKEMLIEYHGSPKLLENKLLEAGFTVTVEKPWTYMDSKSVGFIHAYLK